MREAEDELINDSIDSHCPTDKLQLGIAGVVPYKMVSVETLKSFSPNTTSHLEIRVRLSASHI